MKLKKKSEGEKFNVFVLFQSSLGIISSKNQWIPNITRKMGRITKLLSYVQGCKRALLRRRLGKRDVLLTWVQPPCFHTLEGQ
jgi:hypothetical protein